VSEKSMENAHDDASEAKEASNHSAFQPQKGIGLAKPTTSGKIRLIRAKKRDSR